MDEEDLQAVKVSFSLEVHYKLHDCIMALLWMSVVYLIMCYVKFYRRYNSF